MTPGRARATKHMADWLRAQTETGRLYITDHEFAAQQFFALCQARVGLLRNCGMLGDVSEATRERIVEGAVALFLCYYGERR